MPEEEEITDAPEDDDELGLEDEAKPTSADVKAPEDAPTESEEDEKADDGTEESDDEPDESTEAPQAKQGFVARYWMLALGIMLALVGIAGMIALRTNYAQVYIFGEFDPYTGIGPDEAMGHMVSVLPFVIGVVAVVFWGIKTPYVPDAADELEKGCTEEELDCAEEFGHEHLPPHHLSAEEKLEHLAKSYSKGKISKGLYEENLHKFEVELERERAEAERAKKRAERSKAAKGEEAAAAKERDKSAYKELKSLKPEMAKNEEDHLPPTHMSPEEKIDHLTKSYSQGKVSQAFFEKNIKKFEVEMKREKEYLPPQDMHPRQKLEHLEDAYGMSVISRSTYEKNKKVFEAELESHKESVEETDVEFKSEVAPEQTLDDLDELLKDVETEEQKKPEAKKRSILEELEDLEDL